MTGGALFILLVLLGESGVPPNPRSQAEAREVQTEPDTDTGWPPTTAALPADGSSRSAAPHPWHMAAQPASPGLTGAPRTQRCTVSDILEPSCGVWWGTSPWQNRVEPLERAVGRTMDIVYTWHGVDQTNIPNRYERQLMAGGRFVHVNIEARRVTRPGRPEVSYREILRGGFDRTFRSQARAIADLGTPIFVTFDHEADGKNRYKKRGTPQEFKRAWRRLVDIYREEGADNAIWVWNVTGWHANLHRLPGLWPGNHYVDWISWEAYNMSECDDQPRWTDVWSFEKALSPAYRWFQNQGPKHGIDPDKPMMISEFGTNFIGPAKTESWYADIPELLRKYERIRAVEVWDNKVSDGCDFRVRQHRSSLKGFTRAGKHPYVNIRDRVLRTAGHAHRD